MTLWGQQLVDTAMKNRWTVEDSAKASAVTIHRFQVES